MIYLVLIGAFFSGWYLRELLTVLKRIETRIALIGKSDKPKTPQTNFGDVMTRAEVIAMMEAERVEAMNQ